MKYFPTNWLKGLALSGLALGLMGCPVEPLPPVDNEAEYDLGFDEGFAEDEEYWQGFDDSYDTVDGGTIFYQGDTIPYYDEISYEAGYWDGVYYAYHDGYFVAYDYAFTIGFSEGYDLAFYDDYEDFLQNDVHVEWLDGGFSDGYNDGFSEGRVFGAFDWLDNRDFDWLDAMLDYREGTDLTVAGVSTGVNGPVTLYEWGQDPFELVGKMTLSAARGESPLAIRATGGKQTAAMKQADEGVSYRPLIETVRSALTQRPATSARGGDTPLRVEENWLERVEQYRAVQAKGTKANTRTQ